jgi:hypothetical protein
MAKRPRSIRVLLCVLVWLAGRAAAAPIDSDLADARIGGGCHPTGVQPGILDMLTLINPEWAPIVNGQTVDSAPVLVSGTVERIHGQRSGDFPSTHAFSDVVLDVHVDPEHEDKVATGNDEEDEMAFEWEVVKYPDWAWPGFGDRVYGLGRHIFDCGHTGQRPGACSVTTSKACVLDSDCRPPLCSTCGNMETCEGEHFGYSSELHPPHAAAAIRQGRGGMLSKRRGAKAVPVTIADVWVSPDGGGAGDNCVLTHQATDAAQLAIQCWPLRQPVAHINAQDFTFTLPLPPRPTKSSKPRWRLLPPPASIDQTEAYGDTPARVRVRKLAGPNPALGVTIRTTKKVRGKLPTGFAGRFVAGWNDRKASLTHVRVTVSAVLVDNALQRVQPIAPRTCSVTVAMACDTNADCPSGESCLGAGPVKGWNGQAAVNGEWRRFSGSDLDQVVDGSVVPQSIVLEQYLPADGNIRIQADAYAHDCIDTVYATSLADSLVRFGLNKGIVCLGAGTAHFGGEIDMTYPGPDFGAGTGGGQTYETRSSGGEGGTCSATTAMLCVADADCPTGETCNTTGGAFRLRYTIEKLT